MRLRREEIVEVAVIIQVVGLARDRVSDSETKRVLEVCSSTSCLA
jgi:hypothetical protein